MNEYLRVCYVYSTCILRVFACIYVELFGVYVCCTCSYMYVDGHLYAFWCMLRVFYVYLRVYDYVTVRLCVTPPSQQTVLSIVCKNIDVHGAKRSRQLACAQCSCAALDNFLYIYIYILEICNALASIALGGVGTLGFTRQLGCWSLIKSWRSPG